MGEAVFVAVVVVVVVAEPGGEVGLAVAVPRVGLAVADPAPGVDVAVAMPPAGVAVAVVVLGAAGVGVPLDVAVAESLAAAPNDAWPVAATGTDAGIGQGRVSRKPRSAASPFPSRMTRSASASRDCTERSAGAVAEREAGGVSVTGGAALACRAIGASSWSARPIWYLPWRIGRLSL